MGKHDHDGVVKLEHLTRHSGPCLGVCTGKDCARAGAKQVLRALREALAEAGLSETVQVALTKCQDNCDDGPTVTVLPGGYTYVELDAAAAQRIVLEHVRDGRPVLGQLHRRQRRKLERRMARAEAKVTER